MQSPSVCQPFPQVPLNLVVSFNHVWQSSSLLKQISQQSMGKREKEAPQTRALPFSKEEASSGFGGQAAPALALHTQPLAHLSGKSGKWWEYEQIFELRSRKNQIITVREDTEDKEWSRGLGGPEKESFWSQGKSLGILLWGSLKMPRRRQGRFGEDYRRQVLQLCGKPELHIYSSYRSVQSVPTHMERALTLMK